MQSHKSRNGHRLDTLYHCTKLDSTQDASLSLIMFRSRLRMKTVSRRSKRWLSGLAVSLKESQLHRTALCAQDRARPFSPSRCKSRS